jgi:fluoride exporter
MRRSLRPLVAVAIGGMVGSLIRWALIALAEPDHATLMTFAINVVGSLLLGGLMGKREHIHPERLLAAGTGFAGGLTTFAGYAVAVAAALDRGAVGTAMLDGVGTAIAALLAAGIGFRVMRLATVRRAPRRPGAVGGGRP